MNAIAQYKRPTVFVPSFFDSFLTEFDDMFGKENGVPYNVVQCVKDNQVKATQIEVALAGYDKSEIKVRVVDDELRIFVEKLEKKEEITRQYLHKGLSERSIQLKFTLSGMYDKTKIKSSFENGLLIVNMPVSEEKVKDINIE